MLHEDIGLVCDMVRHAQETEKERRRWEEWCAFSPVALLLGHRVKYSDFQQKKPQEAATDEDINDIRKEFGL